MSCVSCLSDGHCDVGQVCINQVCRPGCSLEHPSCGPDGGACDVDMGVCRGCFEDDECPSPTPRCELVSGRCVVCLSTKDNCPTGTYCSTAGDARSCVAGCKYKGDCQNQAMECCEHVCIDVTSDEANCGSCDHACLGATCCDGECFDLDSSLSHCGSCENDCRTRAWPHVVEYACVSGKCALAACEDGWARCPPDAGIPFDAGCPTHVAADIDNCGSCGFVCPGGYVSPLHCIAGHCGLHAFLSSVPYLAGELGSAYAADSRCYNLATAAGLPVNGMVAWVSDDSSAAKDRLSCGGGLQPPYYLVDGTQVVSGCSSWITGVLQHPVNRDENGNQPSRLDAGMCGNDSVWTNTNIQGNAIGAAPCDNWTSNVAGSSARVGQFELQGSYWTDTLCARSCSMPAYIYCLEYAGP